MYITVASATDSYGHALHSLTKEEHSARNAMLVAQAAHAKAWHSTSLGSVSAKKLKKMVREGVPADLRRKLWLELSGGQALKQQASEDFFATLASRPVAKVVLQEVEADIFRHFPGHRLYSTTAGIQAVAILVQAYIHHAKAKLEANLVCMTAFLVSVVGVQHLEDCFWILTGLLRNVVPPSCVPQEIGWAEPVDCLVLEQLLRKRCPKFMAACNEMDISVHDITCCWFSRLFCTSLPAETVVRIWDCLMLEGGKVLVRVALALVKKQESAVVCNAQKLRNLEWRISRTFNADDLFKVAFHGIGSLSTAVITRYRQELERQVQREAQNHAQRLEALFCPPKISPQTSVSSATTELPPIVELD